MGESVRARIGGGAPKSATLHRVLRSQPGGGFHHGEGNPLPYKAVIVDEASMIDLALMERLVAALSEEARLVLIGDPDQLPSVEAGQVLTDLLSAAAAGGAGGGEGGGEGAPPAARGIARLTRSYRVDAGDAGKAILTAAAAVLAGDAKRLGPGRGERLAAVRHKPADVTGSGVEFLQADAAGALAWVDHWWQRRWQAIEEAARREYRRVAGRWEGDDEARLASLLAAHEASRLLAVTRSGTLGSQGDQRRCHAACWPRPASRARPSSCPASRSSRPATTTPAASGTATRAWWSASSMTTASSTTASSSGESSTTASSSPPSPSTPCAAASSSPGR
jgi:hypothetical protein